MKALIGVFARLVRFHRDERGSMVIFGLFLFLLMLAVGGFGVDLMRYEAQRTRLQNTLDRAVLAAASKTQTADPVSVVEDYFDKADLGEYLLSVTVNDDGALRRVSATAEMTVDTLLMNLSGVPELVAGASGAAEESASVTEISLVLDVSGSMARASASGNSKNWELRHAARQFVNILQCDPERPDATGNCTVEEGKVSISLIPYSEQVLAGETLLAQLPVTDEHSYSSCITFDADDFEATGIPDTHGFEYKRTGHFDPWTRGDNPYSWTCKTDDWREIMPFVSDPADLRHRINSLGASGNTSIDVGLKWGALLLDPDLQGAIDQLIIDGVVSADFDGRPFAYTDGGVKKVIVLMTDGMNTSQHYLSAGVRDGPSPVWYNSAEGRYSIYRASTGLYYWPHENAWEDHPYGNGEYDDCWYSYWSGWQCETVDEPGTAVQMDYPALWNARSWEWFEDFWWLPDPGSSFGTSTKNARMLDLCAAAKAQGITIFTVGFEVPSYADDEMEACASSSAHYFDVDGEDLSDAFAAIAHQISALRLVN